MIVMEARLECLGRLMLEAIINLDVNRSLIWLTTANTPDLLRIRTCWASISCLYKLFPIFMDERDFKYGELESKWKELVKYGMDDDADDDNGVDDDATVDGHASDAVAAADVVIMLLLMMMMLVIMLMMLRILCAVGRIHLDSMFNCV